MSAVLAITWGAQIVLAVATAYFARACVINARLTRQLADAMVNLSDRIAAVERSKRTDG
jgi:hypothetical protein